MRRLQIVLLTFMSRMAFYTAVILSAVGCSSDMMTLSLDLSPVLRLYGEGATVGSVVISTCSPDGVYSDLGRAVIDGNTASFSAIVEKPSMGKAVCSIDIPGGTACYIFEFVAESGHITIGGTTLPGTESNDAVAEALEKLRACPDDPVAVRNIINEFAGRQDKAATILLLKNSCSLIDKELWLTLVESESEDIRTFPEIADAIDLAQKLSAKEKAKEATSPGAVYSDFRGEWEGREYALSDYAGRGQYVLVDFWASWCGPCRKEIPYIIRVHDKYKDKGLVVLGVTVSNDKPEDTAQAMKSLGIEYTVFHEVDNSASEAYGIQTIPRILLIGPDGIVLANDMRGEAIEETVSRFLQGN